MHPQARQYHGGSSRMLLDACTFDGIAFKVLIPSLKPIGCGATAKIFAGQLVGQNGPQLVAVKVFGNMMDDHHHELLIRELGAARQVSLGGHPSILPFIGSATFGLQTAILSHYMKNGNLLQYFGAQRSGRVDKRKMILQVGEAVKHLHTVEGLVHGDLKCANVLVSDYGDALLADFGLSTFVEKAQTSATTAMNVRQIYTVRFAAPEIIRDVARMPIRLRSKTRETDVYAFGMFVLEAITELPPWAGSTEFSVMHWVCAGCNPPRPDSGFTTLWWNICRSCWRLEPTDRPTIETVLDILKSESNANDGEETALASQPRFRPFLDAPPDPPLPEGPIPRPMGISTQAPVPVRTSWAPHPYWIPSPVATPELEIQDHPLPLPGTPTSVAHDQPTFSPPPPTTEHRPTPAGHPEDGNLDLNGDGDVSCAGAHSKRIEEQQAADDNHGNASRPDVGILFAGEPPALPVLARDAD